MKYLPFFVFVQFVGLAHFVGLEFSFVALYKVGQMYDGQTSTDERRTLQILNFRS